ncbi:hypothetical protein FHG87_014733 [Trinorchestia longiramus]|nr:hypothetical protein FHG87_014733 [Trinorchestia longiramus]
MAIICSELHSSTTNEYRDEASFHRPISKQDRGSESSEEVRFSLRLEVRRRLVGCHAQAAEPSQPSDMYKEAATLCFTDSLPSASKVDISTKNSSPEELNLEPTAEQRKQKPAILSTDRMGSNNPHTDKKCMRYNSPRATIRLVLQLASRSNSPCATTLPVLGSASEMQQSPANRPICVWRLQRFVSQTLLSASKVNISTKNSSLEELILELTAEQRKQEPAILSTDRMGSNNPDTNESCTRYNSPRAPTFHVPGSAGMMSVRQYSTSAHARRRTKNQKLI